MAMMKGGQLIAETLVQERVPYIFGICGHGNVGILDALYDVRDKIQLISPRHEQCAGHMADAYYRVKHRPVATLTSTGPGSANMVMSLATALSDSSAFMAITANVPTSQHNRAPFQELYKHNQADFAQVLRPVVKRAFQPTRVDMLPLALRQAMDTMVTGRPGPVNLDIPYNVFQEETCRNLVTCNENFTKIVRLGAPLLMGADDPSRFPVKWVAAVFNVLYNG